MTVKMIEDEVRRIAREVVREELAKLQSDRPDAPSTAGQVRLVHARRSAAGVPTDELRVLLGERWAVDSGARRELPRAPDYFR